MMNVGKGTALWQSMMIVLTARERSYLEVRGSDKFPCNSHCHIAPLFILPHEAFCGQWYLAGIGFDS